MNCSKLICLGNQSRYSSKRKKKAGSFSLWLYLYKMKDRLDNNNKKKSPTTLVLFVNFSPPRMGMVGSKKWMNFAYVCQENSEV